MNKHTPWRAILVMITATVIGALFFARLIVGLAPSKAERDARRRQEIVRCHAIGGTPHLTPATDGELVLRECWVGQ